MKVLKMPFDAPYYFIHGTSDSGSLGSLASHGCIRMSRSDVADLGFFIMEREGNPRDSAWVRRVNRSGRSEVFVLPQPVTLTIRMGDVDVYPGMVWDLGGK